MEEDRGGTRMGKQREKRKRAPVNRGWSKCLSGHVLPLIAAVCPVSSLISTFNHFPGWGAPHPECTSICAANKSHRGLESFRWWHSEKPMGVEGSVCEHCWTSNQSSQGGRNVAWEPGVRMERSPGQALERCKPGELAPGGMRWCISGVIHKSLCLIIVRDNRQKEVLDWIRILNLRIRVLEY